jgi:CHAT domain-containing protein
VLINLAETLADGGDLERAAQVGERALQLAEKLYGKGSRPAAAAERTLGTLALARGDLTRAESWLTRARTTFAKESGDQEPLAIVTQSLALVAHRRGDRGRALELGRQVLDLEKKNLDRILAFGSEAQRLAYRSAFSYDQIANLEDATLLAEAALATKGVVLDSLLAERALVRRSRRAEDRERLDRIHGLKVELMEKIGRGESHLDLLERTLKNEETALARSVAQAASAERSRVDLAQVQAVLEYDQVLIEIVRFQRYEADGKLAPWYGGVVIPHQGRPTWVPLGRAEGLEESIGSLVKRLDAGNRGVERISSLGDVTRTLRELDDRLWKPLSKGIPAGARKVLLSPDGALSFVPWAALLNEAETFLAESWQLTQVGSGRDLLRTAPGSSEQTLLALADGKEDLPFARQEVESLALKAEQKGWRPTVLLGDQASEAALFQRSGPRILHFATHGGALQGDWAQAVGDRLSKRPMYRGFLWLGGAEKTLEAWKRGKVLPFSEDGILTAEEVGGLDLGGTWLTVLSACQSGAGDARSGEGVLGLRRGFALAGTENLLFTLWSVDDESTARFMETFYDRLFQTMDPHRAFQEAQVAELLRWKQDRGIPVAVFRAGAFVLTR